LGSERTRRGNGIKENNVSGIFVALREPVYQDKEKVVSNEGDKKG